MKSQYVCTFQSGHVEYAYSPIAGSIVVARVKDGEEKLTVMGLCRLGYDDKIYVPGVPEARGAAKIDALIAWQRRIKRALGRRVRQ